MKKRFVVLRLENHVLVFDTHTNRVEGWYPPDVDLAEQFVDAFNKDPIGADRFEWRRADLKEMTAYYRQYGKI